MRATPTSARRTLVVGTDFSAGSHKALIRAIDVARKAKATLHVVHAESRVPQALVRRLGGLDPARARHAMEGVVDEARDAGLAARGHLVIGNAAEALSRTAKQVGADLVVVGSRGRFLTDAVVGSTAERVMASARVPVLLVRQRLARPYREVIVAADQSSRVGASVAAATLAAPSASLMVLHVFDVPFESTLMLQGTNASELRSYRAKVRREAHAAMVAHLEKEGVDHRALQVRHGSAARVLLQLPSAALLVIDRNPSLARRVLLGSTTRWVVAQGESDLLLV